MILVPILTPARRNQMKCRYHCCICELIFAGCSGFISIEPWNGTQPWNYSLSLLNITSLTLWGIFVLILTIEQNSRGSLSVIIWIRCKDLYGRTDVGGGKRLKHANLALKGCCCCLHGCHWKWLMYKTFLQFICETISFKIGLIFVFSSYFVDKWAGY